MERMERIGIIKIIGAALALKMSLGQLFDMADTREELFNAVEKKLIHDEIEMFTMGDVVNCVNNLIADVQWFGALKAKVRR